MKRHLLIDHLPVGKTFTHISEIYRSFNHHLSGLSFSDFPIKWNHSSPDYLNKPITIEMIGSTKYLQISNIHTQNTSLPISTTHGTLLSNNSIFVTNWLFENEVSYKTNEISFKIKFTKDSVSMDNVKHCMVMTSTRSACLFFEDFGNYKKNDEFDVKVVVNFDGSSKTYIDGILLANYTTAILPANSSLSLGFVLLPSISYDLGTRINEFGIRDVVISGYYEITEPFKNIASSIVSLQSEDLSVMTTLPYDGTDYESVDLEVTESVGWDFVGSGENPLSSGFDSIDPTLNMTSASLDVPARAVLKGNLTHPSKLLDIRLTSRATLGDKPINVEFNGVTKIITPTGTYKYGELVFQVEDVPAGDFEIIITKEL